MRLRDWEERLGAYIERVKGLPFAWGSHDCALFASAAAAEVTGADRLADFRGTYDSNKGAREALRRIGCGTLLRTIQDRYEEIPPKKATRGDLIWNGFALGVSYGAFALFLGEGGLVQVPRSGWKRAFRA